MMKKQEFCAIFALLLLLIAVGTIEGAWILSLICVLGAAAFVVIGGLTEYKG